MSFKLLSLSAALLISGLAQAQDVRHLQESVLQQTNNELQVVEANVPPATQQGDLILQPQPLKGKASLEAGGVISVQSTASNGGATSIYNDYEKQVNGRRTEQAVDTDAFGEQIELYNGSLSFSVTDVSLPGNSALPVEVRRVYRSGDNSRRSRFDRVFGDWDLDIPHVNVTTLGIWKDSRCSGATPNHVVPDFPLQTSQLSVIYGINYTIREWYHPSTYWHGVHASMPGGGEMLYSAAGTPKPADPANKWMTKGGVHFSCLPTIKNGTGEGFLAIAPDGTKYWFDHLATNHETNLSSLSVPQLKNSLYVTRIEDRFGNHVVFTYANDRDSGARLTEILSSDGRNIKLTYVPNLVIQGKTLYVLSEVNAEGRIWKYAYSSLNNPKPSLTKVTLPDGTSWDIEFLSPNYNFSGSEISYYPIADPTQIYKDCAIPGQFWNPAVYSGKVKHPSGAIAEYKVKPVRFGRSNVTQACINSLTWSPSIPPNYKPQNWQYNSDPVFHDLIAISERTISGVGVTPATTTYAYSTNSVGFEPNPTNPCRTDTCAGRNFTIVTNQATGKVEKYTFGNSFQYDEGLLLKREVQSGTATLRIENYGYELAQSGQSFPTPVASGPRSAIGIDASFEAAYLRPLKSSSITQDGVMFSRTINSFDQFALPLSVTSSSSLGHSKTDLMTYEHNLSKWVIGNVKSVTNTDTNTVLNESTYDLNTALPTQQYGFGRQLLQTLSYNPDGTVATSKDALNRITSFGNYKRGIPQNVTFSDTTTISAVVDNLGQITSTTDQLGNSTGYSYDVMGRLTQITHPANDTVAWAPTTFAFVQLTSSHVIPPGISVGQWRQVEVKGNYRKVTYYDAQWRPVMLLEYEEGNNAATMRQTINRYDNEGRLIFTSYPRNPNGNSATNNVAGWLNSADPSIQGTRTFYDALDRVTKVEQDSELGVLSTTTEYLSGFQTKVSNPRGISTRMGFQVFDAPDTSRPLWIATAEGTPEAQYTEMTRDVFGRTLTQRRRNADSTQQQTRQYVYDSVGRLCKKLEPETNATLYDYDEVNNLRAVAGGITSVPGLNGTNAVYELSCKRNHLVGDVVTIPGQAPSSPWIYYTHDSMNRLTAVNAPGGTDGDKNYFYEADGALNRIQTWSNGSEINNRYSYNKRRLLISESSEQVGWYTWPLHYTYDANANLSRITYPTGFIVDYAPNALGQATQAGGPHGTWASNVQYHPNGAVKQFTYGNGIVHTMVQNARQMPSSLIDAKPSTAAVTSDTVTYDANTNVLTYNDLARAGRTNRSMQFDPLDRLIQVNSPNNFGTALYQYDVLDNLKRSTLGLAGFTYFYDANNRTQKIDRDGGGSYTYTHTAKGEVLNDGRNGYQWDSSGRIFGIFDPLTAATKETYRYDGENRRVLAWMPTGSILSMYGKDGSLYYQHNDREVKKYEYIYLNGDPIAYRDHHYVTGAINTRYQHTDILGSPVATTDETGNVVERTEYAPFGAPLNRPVNGVGYTGHVMDSATNLTYMQQRYYDPLVGRFLSTDPVQTDMDTGYMFNRYYYANNNPYKFVDPDGRYPISPQAGAVANWFILKNQLPTSYELGQRGEEGSFSDHAKGVGKQLWNMFTDATSAANPALKLLDSPKFELNNRELLAGSVTELVAIAAASKGGGGGKGSALNSFADIAANPKLLYGKSASEVARILGDGWKLGGYGKSGKGWKFTDGGNKSVFFNSNGRHKGSYWGFSQANAPKTKVVGDDYVPLDGDKARIIKK